MRNLRKNKLEIGIQAHQPTWCIDSWPYYELEDWIEILNERNEEERKAREDQEKQQNKNMPSMSGYKNMMKGFSPGSYKPPNFKMP